MSAEAVVQVRLRQSAQQAPGVSISAGVTQLGFVKVKSRNNTKLMFSRHVSCHESPQVVDLFLSVATREDSTANRSAAEKRSRSKRHVKTLHFEREATAIGTRIRVRKRTVSVIHPFQIKGARRDSGAGTTCRSQHVVQNRLDAKTVPFGGGKDVAVAHAGPPRLCWEQRPLHARLFVYSLTGSAQRDCSTASSNSGVRRLFGAPQSFLSVVKIPCSRSHCAIVAKRVCDGVAHQKCRWRMPWGSGGVVVRRLLASHVSEPGSNPLFSLIGGFSRGPPVSPALTRRRCSILISFYTHQLSSPPISLHLLTHSRMPCVSAYHQPEAPVNLPQSGVKFTNMVLENPIHGWEITVRRVHLFSLVSTAKWEDGLKKTGFNTLITIDDVTLSSPKSRLVFVVLRSRPPRLQCEEDEGNLVLPAGADVITTGCVRHSPRGRPEVWSYAPASLWSYTYEHQVLFPPEANMEHLRELAVTFWRNKIPEASKTAVSKDSDVPVGDVGAGDKEAGNASNDALGISAEMFDCYIEDFVGVTAEEVDGTDKTLANSLEEEIDGRPSLTEKCLAAGRLFLSSILAERQPSRGKDARHLDTLAKGDVEKELWLVLFGCGTMPSRIYRSDFRAKLFRVPDIGFKWAISYRVNEVMAAVIDTLKNPPRTNFGQLGPMTRCIVLLEYPTVAGVRKIHGQECNVGCKFDNARHSAGSRFTFGSASDVSRTGLIAAPADSARVHTLQSNLCCCSVAPCQNSAPRTVRYVREGVASGSWMFILPYCVLRQSCGYYCGTLLATLDRERYADMTRRIWENSMNHIKGELTKCTDHNVFEANSARFLAGFVPAIFVGGNSAGRCCWSVGFLGDTRFPRLCIPALLHTHLVSLSPSLKTSMLRAAQISSFTHSLISLAFLEAAEEIVELELKQGFRKVGSDHKWTIEVISSCILLSPRTSRDHTVEVGGPVKGPAKQAPRPLCVSSRRQRAAISAAVTYSKHIRLLLPTTHIIRLTASSGVTWRGRKAICVVSGLARREKVYTFVCCMSKVPGIGDHPFLALTFPSRVLLRMRIPPPSPYQTSPFPHADATSPPPPHKGHRAASGACRAADNTAVTVTRRALNKACAIHHHTSAAVPPALLESSTISHASRQVGEPCRWSAVTWSLEPALPNSKFSAQLAVNTGSPSTFQTLVTLSMQQLCREVFPPNSDLPSSFEDLMLTSLNEELEEEHGDRVIAYQLTRPHQGTTIHWKETCDGDVHNFIFEQEYPEKITCYSSKKLCPVTSKQKLTFLAKLVDFVPAESSFPALICLPRYVTVFPLWRVRHVVWTSARAQGHPRPGASAVCSRLPELWFRPRLNWVFLHQLIASVLHFIGYQARVPPPHDVVYGATLDSVQHILCYEQKASMAPYIEFNIEKCYQFAKVTDIDKCFCSRAVSECSQFTQCALNPLIPVCILRELPPAKDALCICTA
ncbi:hypothetical protein PR048_008691 [Dryococelus australis]|uniref:Uncharacterized protein n=1 Tax=Dryococelus australis TaxID=614101 RepID=A0ABQ9HYP7_9NEOP|nr:hypothetical protein PR048_008691 [Dryococelus australis]